MTDATTTIPQMIAPRREVVIGTPYGISQRGLRGLPWAFDDLTREFDDGIYERMLFNPACLAALNVRRSGVIEEGVRLECPLTDEAADGYALGHEIAAFCTSVLNDLQISLDDVLWDLLGAIAVGSRVAEEVWDLVSATTYALPGTAPVSKTRELLILSALKPRPRRSTAFVVDPYMNVVGLLAREQPGQLVNSNVVVERPQQLPNLVPREKFAVLTYQPQNADPRGSSGLRPAYTPWWAHMQIWPEFLKYLAQFASPSIYAVASEQATTSGIVVELPDGSQQIRPAVEVLNEALLAFRNGTALSVPYGTLLKALEVVGNGEAFHKAFTFTDEQITIAILHQTLATREGQHQARAASEEHANTLETLQRQLKRSVCQMLRRDVLRPLVEYNYGPDAARQLTPSCSLGTAEQQDWAGDVTAVARLAASDYLDPSQFAGVDARLGLPARTPEEIAARTERQNQPPPAPPPPPAGGQGDDEDEEGEDESR